MIEQELETLDQLIDAIAEFEHDPYAYVLFAYPWGEGALKDHAGPEPWQVQVLKEIRDGLLTPSEAIQIAVASGHGVGKSALVAWIIDWGMTTKVDTRGVVTANTENQLKTKTWAELEKWHRLSAYKSFFQLEATSYHSVDPDHAKTWRMDIIPWSEKRSEAFAGLHNKGKRILLIFDEGSAIPDAIWEVSEGALTDSDTEMIWAAFGNPTRNTGRFRECWRRFRHRWKSYQIDSRQVAITNKAKIQKWIDDYGEDSDFVKVRVRGMFPAVSAKQFISTEWVDAALGKHLKPEQYNYAPKILACDPAWGGDDELVIAMRQGLCFKILRTIPKNDNDIQVANLIARLEDEHKADAVFIDAGYGTGIVSAGRTMQRNWQLVWFGEKANDAGFLNKRAEMWGGAKKWLQEGGAIPKDDVLYQDLIGPETVPRPDGKIQLESKEQMKERGLASPNRGDALALTFAYPVAFKKSAFGTAGSQNERRNYNALKNRKVLQN